MAGLSDAKGGGRGPQLVMTSGGSRSRSPATWVRQVDVALAGIGATSRPVVVIPEGVN